MPRISLAVAWLAARSLLKRIPWVTSLPRSLSRVLSSLVRYWRRSLQFRTFVITVAFAGLAIAIIGFYISFTISSNLFRSSLDRALANSNNATVAAQKILDSSDASDRTALQNLMRSTVNAIQSVSGSEVIAYFRSPGQPYSQIAPLNQSASELKSIISSQLRSTVQGHVSGQYWQSVELSNADGSNSAGVVVGSTISLPAAGNYELYIGYSFAEAERNLGFMQQAGVIGAIGLVALLTVVSFFVARWVLGPIRRVVETSRKLEKGDLTVRLPERGENELALLSASFNGMADSLQSRIHELDDLTGRQQAFVSDVSHELRTPMTSMRMGIDVLYDNRSSFKPDVKRSAEIVHSQTGRFVTLLDDLLEISRFDAGVVELHREPTELVHLVEEAVEEVAPLALEHGSEIRLEQPGGHCTADLDPKSIFRVIINLLANAIEHGEGRPVVVTVSSNSNSVAVSVRDYGIGMSSEQCELAFTRMWRGDPSRKRTIGGNGLGLAIARETAILHNGELEVWSKLGAGSVFLLTLPRSRDGVVLISPLPLKPDSEPLS